MATARRLPATFAALQNRDYRLILFGFIGSVSGYQSFLVARGYLAYELTGSATILGLVTLSQSAPSIILSLMGGVIADRVQRRRLLMLTQSLLLVSFILTAVLVHSGLIEVWQLVALGVFQGSIFAFNSPSRYAYMIELVNSRELGNAIALFNSASTSTRILAPTLAGTLISIQFIGLTYTFYFVCLGYIVPVVVLLLIRTPPRPMPAVRQAIHADFVEGVRYLLNNNVLRLLVVVGTGPAVLGGSYQALLPVFASDDVLGAGPRGLGLMTTCVGLGGLIGALLVASFPTLRSHGRFQIAAGALVGLGLFLLGFSPVLIAALLSLLVLGFAMSSFETLNNTMAFAVSDVAYYGRISTVQELNWSFVGFAALPIGAAVDGVGAQAVMMAIGVTAILYWCAVYVFLPRYRLLGRPHARVVSSTSAGTEELAVPTS